MDFNNYLARVGTHVYSRVITDIENPDFNKRSQSHKSDPSNLKFCKSCKFLRNFFKLIYAYHKQKIEDEDGVFENPSQEIGNAAATTHIAYFL